MLRGRVVEPGQPAWTDDDRDWALALTALERDTCTCGEPLDTSTRLESDGEYAAEVIQCHACAAQARAIRRVTETGQGTYARIVRRPKGA